MLAVFPSVPLRALPVAIPLFAVTPRGMTLSICGHSGRETFFSSAFGPFAQVVEACPSCGFGLPPVSGGGLVVLPGITALSVCPAVPWARTGVVAATRAANANDITGVFTGFPLGRPIDQVNALPAEKLLLSVLL